MNARALQCFIKVYEKRSISSAAKELYISPQGLSKVIKQLEYDLESELFIRDPQGMISTEAGELLYARARHIIYLMDDIKKEISIINGSQGALNVILTYSAASVISLNDLFKFTENYPNIQIKITEYPEDYPIENLFEDMTDVGIVMEHEGIRNCHYDLLKSGELILVTRKDHPLTQKKGVGLKDLAGEKLALKSVEPGKEHPLLEKLSEKNIIPAMKHESGNITTLVKLCENEGFVAVLENYIDQAFPKERFSQLPFSDRIAQNIYLVTRDREVQSKSVTLFQSYIKEMVIRDTGKQEDHQNE